MSRKSITIALQGGGAHGAFTWGVLDRLLEEDTLEIAAISGTSAGALNGAALKSGLVSGGREGARENLDWLWQKVAGLQDMRMASWMADLSPASGWLSKTLEYSLPFSLADAASRAISPYSYGPFYRNPLASLVEDMRFADICATEGPGLHICATNVRTGKIKVFSGDEISPGAILASACLPTLFQAVEIDGEAYWDGGYTGNPALFPLFAPTLPDDLVVVNINPLVREDLPLSSQDILNRINEISFNSSLLRELRAIEFVQRLIDAGNVPKGAMKRVLVHMIADDDLMSDLSVATKLVPSPVIVERLRQAGRAAAEGFLVRHWDDLGERSTVDLRAMFA